MSQDSSNSTFGGNTKTPKVKQVSPRVKWCFTLNNYTDEQIDLIVRVIESECRMAIFGKEMSSTKTPHLQGYIEFRTKSRPFNVFEVKQIHWEGAKGSRMANIKYCSKEDKNPYCWKCKIPKEVKIIADDMLYDWEKDIIQLLTQDPTERGIYWYWSAKGGIGKTQFCKYLTVRFGAICLNGKSSDCRNGIVQYVVKHGYTPDIVLFPIPRSHSSEYVSYEALENIKDMYFYSGKFEGGMICGNAPHLFVFANCPPCYEKMSEDRWVVVRLDKDILEDDIPAANGWEIDEKQS